MSSEKVSVIMPVLDRGDRIVPSVRSCLNQTYQNLELWVVEDERSRETSKKVCEGFSDERINYAVKGENVSESRNAGIEMSEGEFVGFLDSDDLWKKDYVEKAVEKLEKGEPMVFSHFREVDETTGQTTRKKPYYLDKTVLTSVLEEHTFPPSTAFFKRKVLESTEGFDTDLSLWEDSDLYVRAIQAFGEPEIIEEPLVLYRKREKGVSETASREMFKKNLENFLEKHREVMEQKDVLETRLNELKNL